MSEQEYRKAIEGVIYLAGCAVSKQTPDKARVEEWDLDHLYEAAKRHMLTAAVGTALESAGIRSEKFIFAVANAQRRTALLDADRERVLARLEQERIWYMPLKGAVLKTLYPRFGMREMADNDILFDATRASDVRRIMEELGFTTEEYDKSVHDVYHKEPVSNFEMHRALFEDDKTPRYAYYAGVRNKLVRDDDKAYGYHFTDEDFYLYLVAHEYKHYKGIGTGIRSLLDTYVFLREKTLDMVYIRQELEKLDIVDYEMVNRNLAMNLFKGVKLTDDLAEMFDYIVHSGTYGNWSNHANTQVEKKGRFRFFLSRAFPTMDQLAYLYPILNKAPFLYPFCWILRLLWGAIMRHRVLIIQMKAILGLTRKDE